MCSTPAAATVRRIGSALPTENATIGSPAARSASSVTIESLPPPIGTAVRRESVSAAADASPAGSNRTRSRRSIRFTYANSDNPST